MSLRGWRVNPGDDLQRTLQRLIDAAAALENLSVGDGLQLTKTVSGYCISSLGIDGGGHTKRAVLIANMTGTAAVDAHPQKYQGSAWVTDTDTTIQVKAKLPVPATIVSGKYVLYEANGEGGINWVTDAEC